MTSNTISRDKPQSGAMATSHTRYSLCRSPRKLSSRPQSIQVSSNCNYGRKFSPPALSPHIGSVNEHHLAYNAVSGLMDVDFLQDRGTITNHDPPYSNPGYFNVIKTDTEPQSSSGSPVLSLSSSWDTASLFTCPSSPGIEDQTAERNDCCDSDIVPAPLLLKKKPMIWGSANKQLYRAIKSCNAYSETSKTNTESAKPQPQKSATEEALEQELAQMEHRDSELKQMLDSCEDKLSQVTSELSEIKSEHLPAASGTNFRPVSSQMFSDVRA